MVGDGAGSKSYLRLRRLRKQDQFHGTTPNNYLYRGEQYDPDLGLYYLRARYCNPITGRRFMSRDPEEGKRGDPKSLHKYLYAGGDPVNAKDPTGRDSALEYSLIIVVFVEVTVPKYAPALCAALDAVDAGRTGNDIREALEGEASGPGLEDIFFDVTGMFCKGLFLPGM